ncbi:hypothetical protein C3K47_04190 [Solitalea longa]|uniref:RNA polymerase sigma-70 factor n=2 Tax=Solitalea longa TaxID=2079460 RepID=A0A2S5A8B9_9SPHI|nr:hypothetical protein C3K47_04190 [Solitalea longa]
MITRREVEGLFHANYKNLCLIAVRYLHDIDLAKDIVQEFFVHLLSKHEQIQLKGSFEAYAVRSVKYLCISHLRSQKYTNTNYQVEELPDIAFDPYGLIEDENERSEIVFKLNLALQKLPSERLKIFLMSNLEGLSYAEIAEKNEISINTVKTQIKRSYAALRAELSEISLVSLMLFFKKNS